MPNGNPNPNLKQLITVAIGGALGGLFSVLYSFVIKQQLFADVWLSLIVSIGLGIFAAVIVVFVGRKVDLRNIVTLLVWSMISGFIWRPIVDATSALGGKVASNYAANASKQLATDTSNKIAELKPTLSADVLKPRIADTVGTAVEAVRTLPEVKDRNARDEVAQKLATAANQIGEVAIKNDDPSVAQKATDALNELGKTAVETKSYGVANAVSRSLDEVAAKARDAQVRGQARELKARIDASNLPLGGSPKS